MNKVIFGHRSVALHPTVQTEDQINEIVSLAKFAIETDSQFERLASSQNQRPAFRFPIGTGESGQESTRSSLQIVELVQLRVMLAGVSVVELVHVGHFQSVQVVQADHTEVLFGGENFLVILEVHQNTHRAEVERENKTGQPPAQPTADFKIYL